MESFIQDKPTKRNNLNNWIEFWIPFRSRAFMPLFNCPSTNLAEGVHSSMVSRGSTNVILVDAAFSDLIDSLRLTISLYLYLSLSLGQLRLRGMLSTMLLKITTGIVLSENFWG